MDLKQFLNENFGGFFNKKETAKTSLNKSEEIVQKDEADGSIIVDNIGQFGVFGQFLDLENRAKNEVELINKYRQLSGEPEFDYAISEIVNEMIVIDEKEEAVKIDLEKTLLPDKVKEKINKEFQNILRLLNFSSKGYDIVRQWYVDGKLYYKIIIDDKNPRDGIKEIRNIDPRKIKKVKEILKERNRSQNGYDLIKGETEYYIFNNRGYDLTTGVKIHPDNIVFVHSGKKDPKTNSVVSHLHKAITRFNQLRLLEESVIIYRFTRAPQRNVFYVDIGKLPVGKGQSYIEKFISKYRNKIVYDSETGEVREDKKFKTMLEDIFIPRWNDKNTEIDTIGGNQLSNGMEDVEIFRRQFYLALNIPTSRLETNTGFNMGRATEISREEVKFARFCTRLRVNFSDLFDELLSKQVILKNIVNEEDWSKIKDKVRYVYNIDTHFKELLDQEVWASRIRLLQDMEQFSVRASDPEEFPLFSLKWLKKNVLNQTEDDIKVMDEELNIDKAFLEKVEKEKKEMEMNDGNEEEDIEK